MSKRSKRWAHQRRSVRRPVTPHVAPGTVTVDPMAPPSQMTLMAFGPTGYEEVPLQRVGDIPAWLERYPLVWIDVEGLGDGELLKGLGAMFQLHPLALEDVVNTHQRAKCEDFGNFIFCVGRMIAGPPLVTEQISLFVNERVVLTFQEGVTGDSLEPVRQRIRQRHGRTTTLGTDYLFYELLDSVVEGYFPVLERYGERLDELDDEAPLTEISERMSELHQLRSDFLYLRRLIWPHRDALQVLQRSDQHLIRPETRLYVRDCYDHVVQLIEILEVYRENCTDLREFYYSRVNNRTNEIMRVLTIISTVFLPMTFVAGVYGMNFEIMPELTWPWGYPLSLLLMGGIGVGFLVFFARRGWLQSTEGAFERSSADRAAARGSE